MSIESQMREQMDAEMASSHRELADQLRARIATLAQRVDALQRFKDYVHKRLDDAGVPVDPDSPRKAEGCRIGGRLDWLLGLSADQSRMEPRVSPLPDPVCPGCGGALQVVRQSATSPLNREQFDAAKAGDYFCDKCPSNDRGNRPFRYFWKSELSPLPDPRAGTTLANELLTPEERELLLLDGLDPDKVLKL